MTGKESLPLLTGNDVVDSLQVLQVSTDILVDDDMRKIEQVSKVIKAQRAGELLGHHLMVSSSLVLAKNPDSSPQSRTLFAKGLVFEGQLDSYEYLLDNGIPIDSLTLNFIEPSVFGVEPEDEPFFRSLRLQVPVLAISTCIDTRAA
jgi:hypothetical protein